MELPGCSYAAKRLYLRWKLSCVYRRGALPVAPTPRLLCVRWQHNHAGLGVRGECLHYTLLPLLVAPGPRLWRDSINYGDFYDLRLVLSGLGAVPDK
jgi:hypothetical protein